MYDSTHTDSRRDKGSCRSTDTVGFFPVNIWEQETSFFHGHFKHLPGKGHCQVEWICPLTKDVPSLAGGQASRYSARCDVHGAVGAEWDHCLSGEGEGRGSALPAQGEECPSAGSDCVPAAEEPRNEGANHCTELLHQGKYREVFHMVACSAKPLNIPTWGNSCHPDPGYLFPSCLIIAD